MTNLSPIRTRDQLHPLNDMRWFLDRIQVVGECWEWTGARLPSGYGTMSFREDGRVRGVPAHRFAYILCVGAIPSGHEVDHLCRNPHCVNPRHLEAVTPDENIRRARVANRAVSTELAAARERAGLTVHALAAMAGISAKTLIDLEYGRRSPQRRTRESLAAILGATVGDLFPTGDEAAA